MTISLVDRRQLREVALDARDELLVVRLDQPQARLTLLPLPPPPGVGTYDGLDARPLCGDHERHGGRDQSDPRPAHAAIVDR